MKKYSTLVASLEEAKSVVSNYSAGKANLRRLLKQKAEELRVMKITRKDLMRHGFSTKYHDAAYNDLVFEYNGISNRIVGLKMVMDKKSSYAFELESLLKKVD